MSKLIHDWKELSEIPKESKTHTLEVDINGGCGYLHAKNVKPYKDSLSYMRQLPHLDVYLSTHTFYGRNYEHSTKLLKACGFDVELANWDEEEDGNE